MRPGAETLGRGCAYSRARYHLPRPNPPILMKKLSSALLGLLCLAPATHADVLNREWVPAASAWVAHVNFEAFQTTAFGRALAKFTQSDEFDIDGMSYAEFEAEWGFDPIKDLRSVTVFDAHGDMEEAAVLVVASPRVDNLFTRLREEHPSERIDAGGLALEAWGHGGDRVLVHRLSLSTGDRLLILSSDQQQVTSAVQVLRGDEPNMLSVPESAALRKPTPGSFVYVTATGGFEKLSDFEPASQLAEMARSFMFELGESSGRAFARLSVEARSGSQADDLAAVINGARAFVGLAASQEDIPDEVREMLRSLRVNTQGTNVVVEIDFDAHRLVELVHELADEHH